MKSPVQNLTHIQSHLVVSTTQLNFITLFFSFCKNCAAILQPLYIYKTCSSTKFSIYIIIVATLSSLILFPSLINQFQKSNEILFLKTHLPQVFPGFYHGRWCFKKKIFKIKIKLLWEQVPGAVNFTSTTAPGKTYGAHIKRLGEIFTNTYGEKKSFLRLRSVSARLLSYDWGKLPVRFFLL